MRIILPGLTACILASSPCLATSFNTVYTFAGGGANPAGAPVLGADGALYGTAANGGATYHGAIYRLVPPATPGLSLAVGSVIYSFGGGADGQGPFGGLHQDKAHNLYGTTYTGGTSGYGTVYELTPPTTTGGAWTKTTLYSFTDANDGSYPRTGVIACGKALCGTTSGDYNTAGAAGTVYALTPPAKGASTWSFATIYGFTYGSDGSAPYGELLRNKAGTLFGTSSGYLGGTGAAFSLTPPATKTGSWSFATLHDFPFGTDGYTPLGGLVADSKGVLYGTTVGGGTNNAGTVYRLTPPAAGQTAWTEDVLASFPTGTAPLGAPAFGPDGLLYVAASGGGANSHGSILALKRSKTGAAPWSVTDIHDFAGGTDGENPLGGFVSVKGVLYGVTSGGDDTAGTVFAISK